MAGRSLTVIREGRSSGQLRLAGSLLIENGDQPKAFTWDGRRMIEQPAPAEASPVPASVTWRYGVRQGKVVARTSMVRLQPRQILRVSGVGGGATSIVIPDPRLDVLEVGYRQRMPGTYTIRIVTPFTPLEQAYTLIVVVDGEVRAP